VLTGDDAEFGDPSNTHTFKIVTTKRTLLVCAPSEEDEIKWLGAIRALIARRMETGAVPGERQLGGTSVPASMPAGTSVLASEATITPSNVASVAQPSSPGPATAGSGLKGKVRRLSASSGLGSSLGVGKIVAPSTPEQNTNVGAHRDT
jgi:pleckstrin homology domain-containing family A member 1/2